MNSAKTNLHTRVFRKYDNIDNVDISDIFVNIMFQSGRDYQLCIGTLIF